MDLEEIMSKRIESLEDVPNGTLVSCIIDGYSEGLSLVPEAKVTRGTSEHSGRELVILCQNVRNGHRPKDSLGYRYGWQVGDGSPSALEREYCTVFEYGTPLEGYCEHLKEIEEELRRKKEEEARKKIEQMLEDNKKVFVQNVLKYVERNESSPLFFRLMDDDNLMKEVDINNEDYINWAFNEGYWPRKYFESLDGIDKLVYTCIVLAKYCYSVSLRLGPETSPGRKRSSIDIWRHIISIHPEVTIFQVMESLYRIGDTTESKVKSWYCSTAHRQVFHPGGSLSSLQLKGTDEYKNYFGNWKYAQTLYEEYLKNENTENSSL